MSKVSVSLRYKNSNKKVKALYTHRSHMNTTTVQEVTVVKNKVFTSLFWDKLDWLHLQDTSRMETCDAFLLFLGHRWLQLEFFHSMKLQKVLRRLENVTRANNSTAVVFLGGFEVKTGGGITAQVLKKAQNMFPTCLWEQSLTNVITTNESWKRRSSETRRSMQSFIKKQKEEKNK